jgi:hypothetical protein
MTHFTQGVCWAEGDSPRIMPTCRGWGPRCRASAIAARRSLAFASDDEDALTLWTALTNSSGHRTRDLLRLLVSSGAIEEDEAPSAGPCHALGAPHPSAPPLPWGASGLNHTARRCLQLLLLHDML